MSDLTFETQLARQLRAYAEGGVRPVDRFVVAEEAIAAGRTGGRWRLGLGSLRGNRALVPLLVGLLLAALAGGALVVGSRLLAPSHPILGVFEPVGPMPVDARDAVVLPDGRVVVAGQERTSTLVWTSLYAFDPGSGGFARLGERAGTLASITALRDGRILIVGPRLMPGVPDMVRVIFDPATGRFTEVGETVAERGGHAAVTLLDGRVLLVGGNVGELGGGTATATAEIFDPATGRFAATGTMSQPRGPGVTATLLGDGKVVVAGGTHGDANGTAELYDPGTGTFAMTGRMSAPRTDFTATLLRDGRVLFAGGYLTDDRVANVVVATDGDIYDPSSATFSPTSPMQLPRVGHVAALLRDGRVLIAGGWRPPARGSAEIFDPVSGTFQPTGPLTDARERAGAAVLPDGDVLVFGDEHALFEGGTVPGVNSRSAEVFR
jgi:hypothetical protein